MKPLRSLLFITVLLLNHLWCSGQAILIDRGVRVNGLWCFPILNDTSKYLYIPDNPHLALDEEKQPQFSFIRYVKNVGTTQSESKSITEAQGGAVLHFLISYDTPQERIDMAQAELQQISGVPDAKIKGPYIFKEGRFILVSSILNSGNKNPERTVITSGSAPVLEGGRIAMSFEMNPERSKLLLENFKMTTPDVSVVFDMTLEGIADAYNATLTVNWSDIYKSEKYNTSGSLLFFSGEVEKSYEDFQQTKAIKLDVIGSDVNMDNLLTVAYEKLTELIFTPVNLEELRGAEAQVASQRAAQGSGLFDILNPVKLLGLDVSHAYKLKEVRRSGTSVLNFNKRDIKELHHLMVFNLGDFYKRYGNNKKYFKTINLEDTDFMQREIFVGIDGDIVPEFERIINNITVTLRKTHENGEVTIKEINFTKNSLNQDLQPEFVYGSISDKDRNAWLNYEYKAIYNFKGGKSFETGWVSQAAAMINLYTPYERRTVKIDGDINKLKAEKIRAVIVQLEYPFFGSVMKPQVTYKSGDSMENKNFEITLPTNIYEYAYSLTFVSEDGKQTTKLGKDSSGILFIDNFSASD